MIFAEFGMEKRVVVLNPDYHFKNDNDRIVMYSKQNVCNDSAAGWVGYIHPLQAMLLGLFTDEQTLEEHYKSIGNHFQLPPDAIKEYISPYICNPTPIYATLGDTNVLFPKNVLLPIENVKGRIAYDFDAKDLNCTNIDMSNDRMHKAPHSILFMLTNKCVTKCKYCYADCTTRYNALTTEQIIEVIHEAHRLKMSHIDVIGGEVFCRKDWEVIIKELVDLDLSPNYISTKMPISKTIVEKLYNTGYKNVIQISLDALDEDILQETIQCKNGYLNELLYGIDLLQERGFKIQVNTILTKYNVHKNQILDLYNYIKNIKNLAYWEIRVPEASIYTPKTFKDIKASKSDIIQIRDFINKELIQQTNIPILLNTNAIDVRFQAGDENALSFDGGTCSMLSTTLFILPDGKVSICEQLYWHPQFIVGDITKQSFEEIWNSDKVKHILNLHQYHLENNTQCSRCQIMELCSKRRRSCVVKIIKAYGCDKWYFPDPRCQYAPQVLSDLLY